MSVARLRGEQGKRQQAHELLAPIFGWFTEGFNTRDLMEANALLGELVVRPSNSQTTSANGPKETSR
jgi:predicted ATPase